MSNDRWDAERFEEMLRALLRGEVEIEDICGEIDRIHTFREYGMMTTDSGLVVTMRDGKRIVISIQ